MNRRVSSVGRDFNSFQEDYVGRITYNYNDRYFLELNGDYNGSEKFSNKYRFGFFPSIGVGWMISNENWFQKKVQFINHLKVRYSNGRVGSDDGIARWQYVTNWNALNRRWQFGNPRPQSSYNFNTEGAIANPDIHWATADKQDLGIETNFLESMFSVNFDLFWERRWDMFVSSADRTTNAIFGADLPAANLGKVNTHGYELDVEFRKQIGKVALQLHVTHSFAKDKVIVKDDPQLEPAYQQQAGFQIGQTRSQLNQPIMQTWDQVYTGVLGQNNSQVLPGSYRQVDFNADGVIDTKDAVPWGYPTRPQHTYTFGFNVTWHRISLSANFYGVYNVNESQQFVPFFNQYNIVRSLSVNGAWIPQLGQTTSATYSSLRDGNTSSNSWVWDASSLSLQNAQISYNLPSDWFKNIGVSNLNIYANGSNLLFWSKLPANVAGNSFNPELFYTYPVLKRFNFGLNITL